MVCIGLVRGCDTKIFPGRSQSGGPPHGLGWGLNAELVAHGCLLHFLSIVWIGAIRPSCGMISGFSLPLHSRRDDGLPVSGLLSFATNEIANLILQSRLSRWALHQLRRLGIYDCWVRLLSVLEKT